MRMDLSGLTATPALPPLLTGETVVLGRRSEGLPMVVAAAAAAATAVFVVGGTLTSWQRCRMAMSEEDI